MKSRKSPFVNTDTLNAKAKSFGSIESIVASVAKSLQETFAKLPPLNILTVGASRTECIKLLRLLFGPRYLDPDHAHSCAPGITQYKAEKHPLCIYQAELHSNNALELNGILTLMRDCEKEPQTALDLLIFCAEDASGQLAAWEQQALVRLSMEVDVPLLVMLNEGASAESVQRAQRFLEEETPEGQRLAAADTKGLCTGILRLLQPEPQERGKVRAVIHAAKTKLWPDASVQNTFVHLERLDYDLKSAPIYALINKTAVATSTKAAIPIGSDAAVMIPLEAAMMAGITAYFEVKVSSRLIKTLLPAVLGTSAATFTGKLMAGTLQFIPNLLTFVTAKTVNAGTAFAITHTIGRSYYQLLLAIEQNEISEEELGSDAAIDKLKRILKTVGENSRPKIDFPFHRKQTT